MIMKNSCIVAVAILVCLNTTLAQGTQTGTEPDSSEGPYEVGIEDVLQIVVWDEPELTMSVTVRPDGYITIPLIDDLKVSGSSPQEIRNMIQTRLAEYIQDPNVTVIVEEINSYKVFVLGEVNAPGMLNFQRPTRLLQSLATAGGLTQYSKKEAVILRYENGAEKRIPVDLKRLIAGIAPQGNLVLKPNDTVIVL